MLKDSSGIIKPFAMGKKGHTFPMFGFFFLFNGISTILGYLMPYPFFLKNSSGTN